MRSAFIIALFFITALYGQFSGQGPEIPDPAPLSDSAAASLLDSLQNIFEQTDSLFNLTPNDTGSSLSVADYFNLDPKKDTLYKEHRIEAAKAAAAYKVLSGRRDADSNLQHITHGTLLKYLEKKPEVKKVGFLSDLYTAVQRFYSSYIEPLIDKIIDLWGKKIGTGGRIIFTVIGCIMLIAVSVLFARILPRFVSVGATVQDKEMQDIRSKLKALPLEDLMREAARFRDENNPRESVRYLYAAMLKWLEVSRSVKPVQWWTNRQLIVLLAKQGEKHLREIEMVIELYELIVFGHRTAGNEELLDAFNTVQHLFRTSK